MTVTDLSHVNIRTTNLDLLIRFYTEILGMTLGDRPPFPFPGAWLYCGTRPVVHLVGVERKPAGGEPSLEHFAFDSTGLDDFLQTLARHSIGYRIGIVPEWGITQVNIEDPDGNHLHIDFPPGDGKNSSHPA